MAETTSIERVETKGLVDKLEGIHRGDLILLENEQGNSVVGFVWSYKPHKISLSKQNKFEVVLVRKAAALTEEYRGHRLTRDPETTYSLKDFDSYSILKKYEAPSKKNIGTD